MKMILKRTIFTEISTIGELWIGDQFECYTLEDVVREPEVKIPKETAIPYGTYEVVLDWSDRHRCLMFHIIGVRGFEGIRFDIANKPEEIEGCIAVGHTKGQDAVYHSTLALKILSEKLVKALCSGEKLFIEITNPV
jgi:hypothetical protein